MGKFPFRSLVLVGRHYRQNNGNSSSVLNSILLVSGNNCGRNLGNYSAKIIALGLRMLGVSGGVPGCEPTVWGKRA